MRALWDELTHLSQFCRLSCSLGSLGLFTCCISQKGGVDWCPGAAGWAIIPSSICHLFLSFDDWIELNNQIARWISWKCRKCKKFHSGITYRVCFVCSCGAVSSFFLLLFLFFPAVFIFSPPPHTVKMHHVLSPLHRFIATSNMSNEVALIFLTNYFIVSLPHAHIALVTGGKL